MNDVGVLFTKLQRVPAFSHVTSIHAEFNSGAGVVKAKSEKYVSLTLRIEI